MKEDDIYRNLARHLRTFYASTPFHFDLSGVYTTSRYYRGLYGFLNDRAWPDLFIAAPSHPDFGDYKGLFLEIKKDGTRIRRRDGELVADTHLREQAAALAQLDKSGYYAAFGVGYDSCRQIVDEYLTGKKQQSIEF